MGEFVSQLGNPWLASEFNLTRQGEFLLRYGQRRAEQFAEVARKEDAKLPPGTTIVRNYMFTKKIGTIGGGGGSSGSGAPT